MSKETTRYKSNIQEKRIAKAMGAGSRIWIYSILKGGCNSRRSIYRGKNKDEP